MSAAKRATLIYDELDQGTQVAGVTVDDCQIHMGDWIDLEKCLKDEETQTAGGILDDSHGHWGWLLAH